MESNGTASFRHRNSPSERFLGLFSEPQTENPSGKSAGSVVQDDDFDEDDVFWTGDFAESSRQPESSPVRPHRSQQYQRSFRQKQSFGILAALPEDDKRGELGDRSFVYRKPSIPSSPSSSATCLSSSRMIQAIQIPQIPRERDYSQSVPVRNFRHSLPVDVPLRSRAKTAVSEVKDEDSENEMLPPHEIIAKRYRLSGVATFSVLEGVGRTLKGRDLRQVRNAVLQKTGFLD